MLKVVIRDLNGSHRALISAKKHSENNTYKNWAVNDSQTGKNNRDIYLQFVCVSQTMACIMMATYGLFVWDYIVKCLQRLFVPMGHPNAWLDKRLELNEIT